MRWVDKYKKYGEIKRHNRTQVAYKIDKNEIHAGRNQEK